MVRIDVSQVKGDIKKSVEVYLWDRVPKADIEAFSDKLRRENSQFQNFFVTYWLEGVDLGSAWAQARWNPDRSIKILGLTIEEVNNITNASVPANDEFIGSWLDGAHLGKKISIYKRDGTVMMHRAFPGGEETVKKLLVKRVDGRERYTEEGNTWGEFWIIDESGDLQVKESKGQIIRTMPKLESAATRDVPVQNGKHASIDDSDAKKSGYPIDVNAEEITPGTVEFTITTDIPLPVEVMASVNLAGQKPNDTYIGYSQRIRLDDPVTTIALDTNQARDGDGLPAGEYEAEVAFYNSWGAENGNPDAKSVPNITSAHSIRLEANGEPVEEFKLRTQRQHMTTTEALAFDFGYAMQASGSCKGLFMRLDTEKKLEAKFGIKLRGPDAPHKDAYLEGLIKAGDDEDQVLCKNAWAWYGCSGTKHARLLIENPFGNERAEVCPY